MSVLVVVWLEGLGWLLGAKAWFPAFAGMADVAGSLNPVEACGMAPGSRETTTRALTQRIADGWTLTFDCETTHDQSCHIRSL